MIILRIKMNALLEKRTEVMQTLLSMIGPTENERGCLSCRLSRDVEDRNVFNLREEWEARENLEEYIKSDRFSVLLGTKSLLCEPQQIEIYTVSHSEGMEAVHAARGKKPYITTTEVMSMKPENSAKIKYGIWGLVCGAIITIIIGFAWGGWSTAGTTKQLTQKAVVANDAAICEAQFMAQPNYADKLKEFEKESSWERPKYVETGGWDKMPGQKEADYAVSRACADRLDFLAKK